MAFSWSSKNLPKQIFINNEYVDSKSSKKLSLYNPTDGSLIADDVPLAGEEDVDIAVAAAEKAFPAWKKLAPNERRNIMNKFADLVEENSLAIAELSRISLGAPYKAFGAFEIGLCAEVCFSSCNLRSALPRLVEIMGANKYITRPFDTTRGGSISSAVNPGLKKTVFSRLYATSLLV